MDKLKELKKAQSELEEALSEVESTIMDIEEERESRYDDYLDEEGPGCVGSASLSPSMILKVLNHGAYNQYVVGFAQGFTSKDTPEYQVLTSELEECEDNRGQVAGEIEEILQLMEETEWLMEELEELMGNTP